MLFRFVVCILLGHCFSIVVAAEKLPEGHSKAVEKTLFELERSVALLQLSSASIEDVQVLEKQIKASNEKLNWLSRLLFLMFAILLFFAYQLYRQQKRLMKIERKIIQTQDKESKYEQRRFNDY